MHEDESKHAAAQASPISAAVLSWYDRHRRDLPWRAGPGETSDPYRVWLSEIMLQQTTVAAVIPYYARFLDHWPDLQALAAAPLEDVLKAWAGLGYYSRARNLHACARLVVERHTGQFPRQEAGLRQLPGIGGYTAAAIASIAFGLRAVVVDGNIERVMARMRVIETALPAARPALRAAMDSVTPVERAGDFAQAMMDLGATICTPKSPACVICPVAEYCAARQRGNPADYPRKLAKKAVPVRAGAVFFAKNGSGAVLVRTRSPNGLFGGMTEFPGTPWTDRFEGLERSAFPAGICGPFSPLGSVTHGLTHFTLTLHIFACQAEVDQPETSRWVERGALDAEAFPTLMRKVLAAAERAGPPSGHRPEPMFQY